MSDLATTMETSQTVGAAIQQALHDLGFDTLVGCSLTPAGGSASVRHKASGEWACVEFKLRMGTDAPAGTVPA